MLLNLNTYFSSLILFILIQFLRTLSYARRANPNCIPSSCGVIPNITNPFRLTSDPPHCGVSDYQISCENNTTVLYLDSQRYYVQSINYNNYTIRLADNTVTKNQTCSIPQYSEYAHFYRRSDYPYNTRFYEDDYSTTSIAQPATFLSCPYPINYSFYINTTNDRCGRRSTGALNSSSLANTTRYTYVKTGYLNVSDVGDFCTIDGITLISMPLNNYDNVSLSEFHASLLYGFELSWFAVFCGKRCGYCASVGKKICCGDYFWCGPMDLSRENSSIILVRFLSLFLYDTVASFSSDRQS